MKVLVLGAGWYGCHTSMILQKLNIPFKLADICNDFFCGSSSKNQNRLHQSFHYCRSFNTRSECALGYDKFMQEYPFLTRYIPKNYYCIDQKSILDFETYKTIYRYEDTPFVEVKDMDLNFDYNESSFEGIIKVSERFIDFKRAKQYFKDQFQQYMIPEYTSSKYNKDTREYDGEYFDYVIDCTFTPCDGMLYEACVSLLYEYIGEGSDLFAITVMDGPFWSLYPYDIENKIYTLTDVEFTPSGTEESREKMEKKVKMYLPTFQKHFIYKGHFISHKIKPANAKSDDRSLVYKMENNTLTFRGGKITGIFAIEEAIRSFIKQSNA